MKNKIILLLFVCLLLVGCKDKNSLTCKSEEVVSGNTYKTELKFKFASDKVKKAKLTMTVILDENVKLYDVYYNAFEQTFEELKNQEGIDVEVKKIDNGYKALVDVDYTKYNDQIDMIVSNFNKEQTKTYYENLKYNCK